MCVVKTRENAKMKENVRKRREVFVSLCRVWKLKGFEFHRKEKVKMLRQMRSLKVMLQIC
jgi:hypothetical protein